LAPFALRICLLACEAVETLAVVFVVEAFAVLVVFTVDTALAADDMAVEEEEALLPTFMTGATTVELVTAVELALAEVDEKLEKDDDEDEAALEALLK